MNPRLPMGAPAPDDNPAGFTALAARSPALGDDNLYRAARKEQILADWRRFVTCGFQQQDFSRALYKFLHLHCNLPDNGDIARFWHDFFNAEGETLIRFLRQFSATGVNAVYHNHAWLYTAPQDLKLEMCAVLTPLAPVLIALLTGLAGQHQLLLQQWQTLAETAGLPLQPPAGSYPVSDNTRQLLAFAAQSISRRHPLTGLQTMFIRSLEEPHD